jgi:hypothetical protein
MVTYDVRPGCTAPDWFHAAFLQAVSTKAVSSAAATAAAAMKAADAAERAASDTASHDIAYGMWVTADTHMKTAMTAITAVVATFAGVDFPAALAAVNSVKISLAD